MQLTATLEAPCAPSDLFTWIDDLGRYPQWLDIVARAAADTAAAEPTWEVDLAARVGPFRREKRLRMVRTHHEPPTAVRFERREVDGRQHSPWVLDADVSEAGAGSLLTMRLRYGGRWWVPLLDQVLKSEIERSRPRLAALAASG